MTKHPWINLIVNTRKSLLTTLYVTLGFFIFLFAISHILGALYFSSIASTSVDAFNSGISRDLAYLKQQGDEVAKDELFIKHLLAGESKDLIDFTKKEIEARSIGLMGVANSEGVIVSRTISESSLGQNVFLTTPTGRIVSSGKSVESIELTGFGNQLFLTTTRPVIYQNKMIGAIFANYLTDDEYAIRFRDKYLPQGVEVLFYTKISGVYGDSFSDPETRKLIDSYFNSGSDWVKTESSGKTVEFKNHFYIVENVVFPGLEQSPGGALIFVPRSDVSSILNILISVLTLSFLIFFALKYNALSKGEGCGWRYYMLIVFMAILVFILALFALHMQNNGYLKLERIPYALYNSTVRLQPEFGIYDVDFEQRISIMVDTGNENINAVKIGLNFDPKMIEVKALETNNSTCSYVVESKIDNYLGKTYLSCLLIKTGGERDSIKIADLIVAPKQSGTFNLVFDQKDTKVLASDGLGTDVLRMAESGSYRVDVFDRKLFANTNNSTNSTQRSFVVFSPTHPNQSRWYNSDNVHFVWKGKPNAVYKYEFNSSPDTIPSNTNTTQDTSITIPAPGSGIFYFHLQLASGGPVAHYAVQIDRIPPSIIGVYSSIQNIVLGDVVRFSFEAEDVGSGVQQNYYADLGNHLFLPIGKEFSLSFLKAGKQEVTLRVYDGASNYSEKSQIIYVKSK